MGPTNISEHPHAAQKCQTGIAGSDRNGAGLCSEHNVNFTRSMQATRDAIWSGFAKIESLTGLSGLFGAGGDVVMMYHSVGDPAKFGNVSTRRFRRDLELFTNEFTVVDIPEVMVPDSDGRRIAITFDDGYENFFTEAYPILREYDLPATIFLTSGFIGSRNSERISERHNLADASDPAMMTPEQIRSLVDDDSIHIGNHTRNHPRLPDIADRDRLHEEILGAKQDLESEFDTAITRFSYPHGAYDRASVEIVRESHEFGLSSINHQIRGTPDPHLLPRIRGHNPRQLLEWELTGLSERLRDVYERV